MTQDLPTVPGLDLLGGAERVKAALDAYVLGAAVVSADDLDPDQAQDDPRVEGPSNALYAALSDLERAVDGELGIVDEDEDEDEDRHVHEYGKHLLIGVAQAAPGAYDAAESILAEAEVRLVVELEEAGYAVPLLCDCSATPLLDGDQYEHQDQHDEDDEDDGPGHDHGDEDEDDHDSGVDASRD